MKLAVETEGRSAAFWIGIEDYPLGGRALPPPADLAALLRVRLTCSARGN